MRRILCRKGSIGLTCIQMHVLTMDIILHHNFSLLQFIVLDSARNATINTTHSGHSRKQFCIRSGHSRRQVCVCVCVCVRVAFWGSSDWRDRRYWRWMEKKRQRKNTKCFEEFLSTWVHPSHHTSLCDHPFAFPLLFLSGNTQLIFHGASKVTSPWQFSLTSSHILKRESPTSPSKGAGCVLLTVDYFTPVSLSCILSLFFKIHVNTF